MNARDDHSCIVALSGLGMSIYFLYQLTFESMIPTTAASHPTVDDMHTFKDEEALCELTHVQRPT